MRTLLILLASFGLVILILYVVYIGTLYKGHKKHNYYKDSMLLQVPITYKEYKKYKVIAPDNYEWRVRNDVYYLLYHSREEAYQLVFPSIIDFLMVINEHIKAEKAEEKIFKYYKDDKSLNNKEKFLKSIQKDISSLLEQAEKETQEAQDIITNIKEKEV